MKSLKSLLNAADDDSSTVSTPISSNTNPSTDPICPLCQQQNQCGGIGYVRYDVPVGDPAFGKLFRCPNYQFANSERREKLRKIGNLEVFRDKTFDTFKTDSPELSPIQQASLQGALNASRQYALDPQGWLLLEGSYGCGKTHLAAAVGNARLEYEENVLFITSPDLLDYLRHTYGDSSEAGYEEMFERVKNAPLLILDDLGVENPSGWAQEKLFQLLNYRYSRRLSTVITTNADLDMLDPRISSRLRDLSVIRHIKIKAPDYRSPAHSVSNPMADFSLYRDMTFEAFDVVSGLSPEYRQNLERVVQGAVEFAIEPMGWIFLMGDPGTGKTHLAAAIANACQLRGINAIFVTTPDLLDHLRLTFSPGSNISFDHRFQEVKNAPLLVLDDLGTESASAWAKEKLFQIINHRYLTKLPTVFTTSKQIEDLDGRIRARLLDRRLCRLFAITAPPYVNRLRK